MRGNQSTLILKSLNQRKCACSHLRALQSSTLLLWKEENIRESIFNI